MSDDTRQLRFRIPLGGERNADVYSESDLTHSDMSRLGEVFLRLARAYAFRVYIQNAANADAGIKPTGIDCDTEKEALELIEKLRADGLEATGPKQGARD